MAFVQYSIDIEYTDNSYGKSVQKTETFKSRDGEVFSEFFKRIEQWRYDNGHILITELTRDNCVAGVGDN